MLARVKEKRTTTFQQVADHVRAGSLEQNRESDCSSSEEEEEAIVIEDEEFSFELQKERRSARIFGQFLALKVPTDPTKRFLKVWSHFQTTLRVVFGHSSVL